MLSIVTLHRLPQSTGDHTAQNLDSSDRRYRPEVHVLRALAVSLVVIYHVWLRRVSGGVDVFFVISGFLLTGQLTRAATAGRIELRRFWGRLVTRLFPAALTVLGAVIALGILVLPEYRWFATIRQVVASALYVQNWQLAADQANYFSNHRDASVVQHFWSLSVQGQFYLLWPLLIVAIAWLSRRRGWPFHRTVGLGLAVVFAGSLTYSVVLTAADQPLAYFDTFTRLWEFALGGLLTLIPDRVVVSRPIRVAAGWIGLIGLVSCGLVLQVATMFPGYLALWPTLCAALIIAAGTTGSRYGLDRVLHRPVVVYLGKLSYSLYLWHWPILVYYLVARDHSSVQWRGGLVVVLVSVLLAMVTYHLVERPVRCSRLWSAHRWSPYLLGLLVLLPVMSAAGTWQVIGQRKAAGYAQRVEDPDHPGALARTADFEAWASPAISPIPPLVTLGSEFATVHGTCTPAAGNKDLQICATAPAHAGTKTIVVVGDSHIQQYLAAVEPIASKNGWRLVWMLKGACPFSVDADAAPGDQTCVRWNADAAREIIAMRPDLVLTTATRNVRVGLTEQTPAGYVAQWRKLDAEGIPVLAIRDNPRFSFSPAGCWAAHGPNAQRCSGPRAQMLAAEPPYRRIPNLPGNVTTLDLSDFFCTADWCPPVIGNIFVYLDDNHVTATYLRTLIPVLEPHLHAQLS